MGRKLEVIPDPIIESVSADGLHRLEFNERTHRYKLDGTRVPGATTVGHVYPIGQGLLRWMIEQGIEEFDAGRALKKGADIGSFLHKYAELYETHGDYTFTKYPELYNAIKSDVHVGEIMLVISRFIEWRKQNTDEVLMMEELCALPALQVAGRIDTLRERKGLGLVLSDYKTTKSIYVTHLLQVVGGYRPMMNYWHGMDIPYVEIVKFPKQAGEKTETLLLDANGFSRNGQPRVVLPGLFSAFEQQFARNYGTYRFQKEYENVIFPPYEKETD